MRVSKPSFCAVILALLSICAPTARAEIFNFESLTPTFVSPPDVISTNSITSLLLTGSTVNVFISRTGNSLFDLVSNTGIQNDKPLQYGVVSLDPFRDPTGDWILNFSAPVSNVSLDFGDYGDDADDLALSAFSGADLTGALLGSSFRSLSATDNEENFTFNTISVGAVGIRSIRLAGASSRTGLNNSVYFDNLNVTSPVVVPETNTLALIGFALPILGAVISRRRRN